MSYSATCSECGKKTRNLFDYECSCSHPLIVDLTTDFEAERIHAKLFNVWRYSEFFRYIKKVEIITLGEGWTPMVELSGSCFLKLENLNPTGSFKDRGSAVLISALHNSVKSVEGYVSEDSSGNAGASVAAYAARAGLKSKIYVPHDISGIKLDQTLFYGAEVVKICGGRSMVAEEAKKDETGKIYVGHILHPLFRDGMRSLAYEIVEQLNWKVPERIYLPVSAGTLLMGVIAGFTHLVDSNIIDEMPTVVVSQTLQVSPLYSDFKNVSYTPPNSITSIADALISVNPPLLRLMSRHLRDADGDAVVVEENEIYSAFNELARQGFFVEPSSAVAYAAYRKQLKTKDVGEDDKSVVVLTGTGLKTMLKPS